MDDEIIVLDDGTIVIPTNSTTEEDIPYESAMEADY